MHDFEESSILMDENVRNSANVHWSIYENLLISLVRFCKKRRLELKILANSATSANSADSFLKITKIIKNVI